jgi:hypothetical protein
MLPISNLSLPEILLVQRMDYRKTRKRQQPLPTSDESITEYKEIRVHSNLESDMNSNTKLREKD